MDSGTMTAGAVRVAATLPFGQPAVIGILDIENEKGLMTMGAHASAKEFVFPHVVNGNGMFSGLALATGNSGAVITVDVFGPAGGAPKSATIALRANHQLARAVSELVTGIGTQAGGYMRVRSDQPIWAWEIYGSSEVMASAPPLE
jgi:hypothetical protein